MDKTIVIGLTGPTGAGKSTVAQAMLERGCALVDCDKVAREVTDSCEPCLRELSQEFGDDILRDGRLDRRLLASRASVDLPEICGENRIVPAGRRPGRAAGRAAAV